jgi:hypothetical protein
MERLKHADNVKLLLPPNGCRAAAPTLLVALPAKVSFGPSCRCGGSSAPRRCAPDALLQVVLSLEVLQ